MVTIGTRGQAAMGDSGPIDFQAFRVIARPDGDGVRLLARGELDLGTVPAVEREVEELCARGVREIVLDLHELAFIDSSGLNLLLRLNARSRADGFRFAIVEGDGPVRRLLELTNLRDDFEHAEI
jgi:anti-sigma B factor antagonist